MAPDLGTAPVSDGIAAGLRPPPGVGKELGQVEKASLEQKIQILLSSH